MNSKSYLKKFVEKPTSRSWKLDCIPYELPTPKDEKILTSGKGLKYQLRTATEDGRHMASIEQKGSHFEVSVHNAETDLQLDFIDGILNMPSAILLAERTLFQLERGTFFPKGLPDPTPPNPPVPPQPSGPEAA